MLAEGHRLLQDELKRLKIDERPAIAAFKVLREKPEAGLVFDTNPARQKLHGLNTSAAVIWCSVVH